MLSANAITPPRRQPTASTPQSRVRFTRTTLRPPQDAGPTRLTTGSDVGSPSRSREASPLTLPYVDFATTTQNEGDISEESMEMGDWNKGKQREEDHEKPLNIAREDTNTPRRRAIRNGMSSCGVSLVAISLT